MAHLRPHDDREVHRTSFADPDRLADAPVVELDGAVIGDLMVKVGDAWARPRSRTGRRGCRPSSAWVLHPDHTGHGYATEAVRELLRICFDDLHLRRVTADCFARNEASWRLMERLGMRREIHDGARVLHRSGEWLDGLGYALLADEWRGRTDRGRGRQPSGTLASSSSSQARPPASDGIRQSPRGDSEPPATTLGPLGSAERLNWLAKKRRTKTSSQRRMVARSYAGRAPSG